MGTQDEIEAGRLVAQLNQLLGDERWWVIDRRKEAEQQFESVVVAAFFDGMEAGKSSSAERRDARISLPTAGEGYSRILFTGTTGAGKTTLLRHLIGSSHREDRFPSTSTARTTTAEIEIITSASPFEAVVTFMPEHEVRAHVDECIEEACLRAVQGQPDEKIMGAVLSHREQRFRLSYVLGGWKQEAAEVSEDDFSFDDVAGEVDALPSGETPTAEEVTEKRARLECYLTQIKTIAEKVAASTSESLDTLDAQESPDDKAGWLEIFGEALHDNDAFSRLALDIMDDVETRFEIVREGEFERSATGWPTLWGYRSEDREQFIRQLRWFASNHHLQFGRLLTPVADGIRTRGPFFPSVEDIRKIAPKLVLLDGEGIGHTAKAASSISTKVTRRFSEADLILIVDNAEQPMQRLCRSWIELRTGERR
ncbi:MAG: hypothetical protein ACREIA_05330 [Opitutaceae bacterium]